jgi:hypothetical protein
MGTWAVGQDDVLLCLSSLEMVAKMLYFFSIILLVTQKIG